MLTLITEGATIRRVYYCVPSAYGYGDEADTWDEAVEAAQKRLAHLIDSLTETLGGWSTPEYIAETANTQVRIDLRWAIDQPDGRSIDTPVQSFGNVAKLRTTNRAEVRDA